MINIYSGLASSVGTIFSNHSIFSIQSRSSTFHCNQIIYTTVLLATENIHHPNRNETYISVSGVAFYGPESAPITGIYLCSFVNKFQTIIFHWNSYKCLNKLRLNHFIIKKKIIINIYRLLCIEN